MLYETIIAASLACGEPDPLAEILSPPKPLVAERVGCIEISTVCFCYVQSWTPRGTPLEWYYGDPWYQAIFWQDEDCTVCLGYAMRPETVFRRGGPDNTVEHVVCYDAISCHREIYSGVLKYSVHDYDPERVPGLKRAPLKEPKP